MYSKAEVDSVWINYYPRMIPMKVSHPKDSIPETPLYRLVLIANKEWSQTNVLSWDDFIPVHAGDIGCGVELGVAKGLCLCKGLVKAKTSPVH